MPWYWSPDYTRAVVELALAALVVVAGRRLWRDRKGGTDRRR